MASGVSPTTHPSILGRDSGGGLGKSCQPPDPLGRMLLHALPLFSAVEPVASFPRQLKPMTACPPFFCLSLCLITHFEASCPVVSSLIKMLMWQELRPPAKSHVS